MKKVLFSAAFALVTFALAAQNTLKVDNKNSSVEWVGHKVTGKHNGFVGFNSGTITTNNGAITGGSFEVDMNSITCADLQGEWGTKLVGHLKADDFFGVEKNPTSTLTIKKAIAQDTKGNYKFVGDLTIKGITKEVKFFGSSTEANGATTVKGSIKVDRSDFNIQYGSGSFFDGLGDKTIYDEFDLNFSVSAK